MGTDATTALFAGIPAILLFVAAIIAVVRDIRVAPKKEIERMGQTVHSAKKIDVRRLLLLREAALQERAALHQEILILDQQIQAALVQ